MAVNGLVEDDDEDSAEHDRAEVTGRPQSRLPPPPPNTIGRRRLLIGALGVASVAVVGGGAYLIGSDRSKSSNPTATTIDNALTTFRDPGAGFSVAYPKSWTKLTTPDPDVHLLVSTGADIVDSLSIRVLPSQNVDPNNLTDVKAFTDSILSGEPITVLDQKAVLINGIHGYYYLYTLTDKASGQKLAHSHYFLFQAHSMYFIVFQALVNDFPGLAPAAGKVVDSFQAFTPTASATTSSSAPKP